MGAGVRSLVELCDELGSGVLRLGRGVLNAAGFAWELGCVVAVAVRHPRRVRWSSVFYYLDSCGGEAVPIVALLGALIGVILAFQAIVQLGRYGVEAYVVDLVGTVMVTELAPLVTAVVLAGRSGSAFAAELGTMKADEELDAIVTLGLDPGRFLLFPKVAALLLAMPLLTIISDCCGVLGGMVVVCSSLDETVLEYYFRTVEVIRPLDLFQGICKSVFFGYIVAATGCFKGLEAERDAQGVGRATTSAVVTAIFLIVVTDALLTMGFSKLYYWL